MAITAPGIRPASMSAFRTVEIRASRSLERPTSSGFARGRGSSANAALQTSRPNEAARNWRKTMDASPLGLFGPRSLRRILWQRPPGDQRRGHTFLRGLAPADARLLAESRGVAHHRAIKNNMGERCHERFFTASLPEPDRVSRRRRHDGAGLRRDGTERQVRPRDQGRRCARSHYLDSQCALHMKWGGTVRARARLEAVFGVALLLETGLLMSSADAATFVYVGNADSQEVGVLELKSNGDLTPVETKAVPGPAKPGSSLPLAVSPDKKRLYAGLRNEPYSVVTFTVDARTGKLTPLGS